MTEATRDNVTTSAATRGRGAVGYAHADYAASLSEFGDPIHLARCDGWLLRRPIGDTPYRDAMGPYPLFFCRDWSRLGEDLSDLAADIVSVVVVTDPFAEIDPATLARCFDRVVAFKEHYVVELDRPVELIVGRSHRANARRALRSVTVEVRECPWERLDDWERLFANLARRHAIDGMRGFSHRAFDRQLRIPGLVMFEASAGGDVVGLDLWYVHDDVAYGHLAAFSDLGYDLGASYATKWAMLHHFSGKVHWVDLGGTAQGRGTGDGLASYKRGWSTGTKPVYLCGRALQPERCDDLVRRRGGGRTSYFPAYRDGEFG
jgi:GNAT acetyltransferase-like protein